MSTNTIRNIYSPLRNWLLFLVPSLLGIGLFMAPVSNSDGITIPVKILADAFLASASTIIAPLLLTVIVLSAAITLLNKIFPSVSNFFPAFFGSIFNPNWFWTSVRLLGAVFAIVIFFQFKVEAIYSEATGGLLFNDLMPSLLAVFLFAGLLLPLLLNFGLLEFIGTLMTPIMRPLFKLPGRSAIDCSTSWLGDGTVGILLTTKQYQQEHYTKKEAAIIATSFSLVSISFTLVIIDQVGLSHMIFAMYGAISLANLAAAIIMPRIPPLARKDDSLISGRMPDHNREVLPENISTLDAGITHALTKANSIDNPLKELSDGLKNATEMIFGLLPVVLAFGTLALIVAETTPVFNWLGVPFAPLLELLAIPHAQEVAGTLVIGFADMFLPSILVSDIPSELTRFVIGGLSVTQLIYMSEVGALLLASKLPLSFRDLVIIFLLRTLITLPILAGIGHLLF